MSKDKKKKKKHARVTDVVTPANPHGFMWPEDFTAVRNGTIHLRWYPKDVEEKRKALVKFTNGAVPAELRAMVLDFFLKMVREFNLRKALEVEVTLKTQEIGRLDGQIARLTRMLEEAQSPPTQVRAG